MFIEFYREITINRVAKRKLQRHLQHVLREQSHPRSAVGLFQTTALRQRRASIKDANVVETEEAAFEHISAVAILSVDPPCEIEEQLMKTALEHVERAVTQHILRDPITEERCPRVNRRI